MKEVGERGATLCKLDFLSACGREFRPIAWLWLEPPGAVTTKNNLRNLPCISVK
jgi:hypothetical protein